MSRLLPLALLPLLLAAAPVPPARPAAPRAVLPVGKWRVVFANGVVQTCKVGNDGEATVEEPLRRSAGTAAEVAGTAVFRFRDDRAERWTQVGRRYVVEHWCPASRMSEAAHAVGIAEKVP